MSDLQSLIERVEKATGAGLRAIDPAIWLALESQQIERSQAFWDWRACQPRTLTDRSLADVLTEYAALRAPKLTSSIDAALSLVERHKPELAQGILATAITKYVSSDHFPDKPMSKHLARYIVLCLLKAVQAQANNDATEETRG